MRLIVRYDDMTSGPFRGFRDQRPDGTDIIRRSDGYGHSGYGGHGGGGGCSLPGPCALLGVGALLAVGAAAVTAIVLTLQGLTCQ